MATTCDVNAVVKAVVDNGQDQFYSFGIELGMTQAQINATVGGKPSNADKLRSIIDRSKAVVGEEKLVDDLLNACGRLPNPIKGVVEDHLRLQGKQEHGMEII